MDLVIYGASAGAEGKEVRASTTGHFDIWAADGDGHVACEGEGKPLRIMTRGGAPFLTVDWAANKTTLDFDNMPRIDVAERKRQKQKEQDKKEARELEGEEPKKKAKKQKKKEEGVAADQAERKTKKRPREDQEEEVVGKVDDTAPPKPKKPRAPLTPEQLQARREKMAAKKATQQANLEKIVDKAIKSAGLGESDE